MSRRKIKRPEKRIERPATLNAAEKVLGRDVRRRESREKDVERLNLERRLPLMGFNWKKRYSAEYLGVYARRKGWQLSRLTKAVETLDYRLRRIANYFLMRKLEKEQAGR